MFISIAQYIRELVARPQTPVGKAFQEFITELAKKDPHLKNTTPEEFMKQISAIIDPFVGHGLSEDKYDEVMKILKTKYTVKEMLRYISNFMLAGAGMAVQAHVLNLIEGI